MSCTNPNCECKTGTFANMNPPTKAPEPTRFKTWMLDGIEWQQKVAINTATGRFRVEITWALDRYRVTLWRRTIEPEKIAEVRHPLFARTAVATANKMLKYYGN